MSKNIPVNEETYDLFNKVKETIKEVTPADKITNDTLILTLLSSMPGKDKIDAYIHKKKQMAEQLTADLNNNGKKVKQ